MNYSILSKCDHFKAEKQSLSKGDFADYTLTSQLPLKYVQRSECPT